MPAPRIEIDLRKIRHNTRCLVDRLRPRGIDVIGVTKGVCGYPAVAQAMLNGGAVGLADARVSNIERLRNASITAPISLIRTPMLSQVEQVVSLCDASHNTEIAVIEALSEASSRQGTVHDVILMVEFGDGREGILPSDLEVIARRVLALKGVRLKGIGANFACLNAAPPDSVAMNRISCLADAVEQSCGVLLQVVSGGNSASLALIHSVGSLGRTNCLRLGEALLLGVEPLTQTKIAGLHTDAFCLVAEVIEVHARERSDRTTKPSSISERIAEVCLPHARIILGIGQQDVDAVDLSLPPGTNLVGATSDHLVLETRDRRTKVGDEMRFQPNYSAVLRAMSSGDILVELGPDQPEPASQPNGHPRGIGSTQSLVSKDERCPPPRSPRPLEHV